MNKLIILMLSISTACSNDKPKQVYIKPEFTYAEPVDMYEDTTLDYKHRAIYDYLWSYKQQ